MSAKRILQHLESLGFVIKIERASNELTITAFEDATGNRTWVTVSHEFEDAAAQELAEQIGVDVGKLDL